MYNYNKWYADLYKHEYELKKSLLIYDGYEKEYNQFTRDISDATRQRLI